MLVKLPMMKYNFQGQTIIKAAIWRTAWTSAHIASPLLASASE